MKVLAIETANPPGTIALLQGTKTVALSRLTSPNKTTQQFAVVIQDLLQDAGWQPTDIGVVAASQGPGSFTGLRIGVTAAKVFSYATKCKAAGVHSLDIIAHQCPLTDRSIEVVIDAQRKQLFAARFQQSSAGLEMTASTQSVDAQSWLEERAPESMVIGTGLKRIRDHLPSSCVVADEALWAPSAETLGRLGLEAAEQGKTADPMQLVPEYFRKSAAEEKASGP